MDRKEFFVRTIDDLRNRISSDDEYDAIKASGLIRSLIMDGSNLVDEVNREFRLKLTFHYADSKQGYPAEMRNLSMPQQWAILDSLDPDSQLASAVNVVTGRDSFLGQMVLLKDGVELSVKDVIRYAANVLGGVHTGTVKQGVVKEEALAEFTALFGDFSAATLQVRAIGRVVLKGLEPLYGAIKS